MGDAKLVYSSDGSHLKICPQCEKKTCICPKPASVNPNATTLKVRLETNGRGGKAVTVVFELPNNSEFCKSELQKLKQTCGTGGTYKDGRIELQGDHRERVKVYFEKSGFKVKLAGG